MLEQIVGSQELKWLSEPVPALGGLTPRRAVEDPEATRELEALLDDFAWTDRRNPGALTMDAERLRRELGLG